ncbi:MAG: hypothetical protein ACKVP2_06125 [Burkholderiales bacterium]
MKLAIRPLQSVFAAAITGMNLRSPPEKALRQSMDSAMGQLAMKVIRDSSVDVDQHLAFSGAMDPLASTVANVDRHPHRLKYRDTRRATRDHSAPTLQHSM